MSEDKDDTLDSIHIENSQNGDAIDLSSLVDNEDSNTSQNLGNEFNGEEWVEIYNIYLNLKNITDELQDQYTFFLKKENETYSPYLIVDAKLPIIDLPVRLSYDHNMLHINSSYNFDNTWHLSQKQGIFLNKLGREIKKDSKMEAVAVTTKKGKYGIGRKTIPISDIMVYRKRREAKVTFIKIKNKEANDAIYLNRDGTILSYNDFEFNGFDHIGGEIRNPTKQKSISPVYDFLFEMPGTTYTQLMNQIGELENTIYQLKTKTSNNPIYQTAVDLLIEGVPLDDLATAVQQRSNYQN